MDLDHDHEIEKMYHPENFEEVQPEKPIRLSFTSIQYIYHGHEWLNKQMGIKVPDYPFLKEGKDGHRIVQDHVSNTKKHLFLQHIETYFPVVEEKDFDERCKFSFVISSEKAVYEIFGFVDGKDELRKRSLEIKLSSEPWSLMKFRDSMQRKVYALAFSQYTDQYLITGSRKVEEWDKFPPKLFSLKITQKDRLDAKNWILKGIEILESGNLMGGLDEKGKCTGCFWNMDRYPQLANCAFL